MRINIIGSRFNGALDVNDDASVDDLEMAIRLADASLTGSSLKLLFKGRTLAKGTALGVIGCGNEAKVMLIASSSSDLAGQHGTGSASALPTVDSAYASHGISNVNSDRAEQLAKYRRAAETLASRLPKDYHGSRHLAVMEDQHGNAVRLSDEDHKAVAKGMLLQEQARSLMEQEEEEHASMADDAAGPGSSSSSAAAPAPAAVVTLSLGSAAGGLEGDLDAAARMRYEAALSLMLDAHDAFSSASESVRTVIDNPAALALDIAWVSFRLGDMQRLPRAKQFLEQAREGFRRAHGPNLEVLRAKYGEGSVHKQLYVRLRLLEGVLAAVEGNANAARLALQRARAECDALAPRDEDVASLLGFGLSRSEAVAALRATAHAAASSPTARGSPTFGFGGDGSSCDASESRINQAVDWGFTQREKAAQAREARRLRLRDASRQRHLGATDSGQVVNVAILDGLAGAGFDRSRALEAIRTADNDQETALQLLTGEPAVLDAAIARRRSERLSAAFDRATRKRKEHPPSTPSGSESSGATSGDAAAAGTDAAAVAGGHGGAAAGTDAAAVAGGHGGAGVDGLPVPQSESSLDMDAAMAAAIEAAMDPDSGSESEEEEEEDEDVLDAVSRLASRREGAAAGGPERGGDAEDGAGWILEDSDLRLESAAIDEWIARLNS